MLVPPGIVPSTGKTYDLRKSFDNSASQDASNRVLAIYEPLQPNHNSTIQEVGEEEIETTELAGME